MRGALLNAYRSPTVGFAVSVAVLVMVLTLGWLLLTADIEREPTTIGGTRVPAGLDCAEDEVIWWLGVDTLGCVHFEEVR